MDKITGILSSALEGIQTNQRRLHQAAHEIATSPAAGTEPFELVEPLVAMIEAQRAIEASAAVLRRTDEALDSVLEAVDS